jgi:hypothetical protein
MRGVIALAFVLTYAPPVLAQQATQQPAQVEQVVVPTYTHESSCYRTVPCQREATCYQAVPCDVPCPPPVSALSLPCTPPQPTPPVLIHYGMRSKGLFWTGAALVAGGATLIVGSMTWSQASVPTTYPSLPCGTDPSAAPQHRAVRDDRPLLGGHLARERRGADDVSGRAEGRRQCRRRHITVRVGF